MSGKAGKSAKRQAAAEPEAREGDTGAEPAAGALDGAGELVTEPFLEGPHETRMTFDHGGAPRYVIAAWAVFLVAYVVYWYTYGWPDLSSWGAP